MLLPGVLLSTLSSLSSISPLASLFFISLLYLYLSFPSLSYLLSRISLLSLLSFLYSIPPLSSPLFLISNDTLLLMLSVCTQKVVTVATEHTVG
jgi:hypothetical protein